MKPEYTALIAFGFGLLTYFLGRLQGCKKKTKEIVEEPKEEPEERTIKEIREIFESPEVVKLVNENKTEVENPILKRLRERREQ